MRRIFLVNCPMGRGGCAGDCWRGRACMEKLKVMNSTMGRRPAMLAPTAIPVKPAAVARSSTRRRWGRKRAWRRTAGRAGLHQPP